MIEYLQSEQKAKEVYKKVIARLTESSNILKSIDIPDYGCTDYENITNALNALNLLQFDGNWNSLLKAIPEYDVRDVSIGSLILQGFFFTIFYYTYWAITGEVDEEWLDQAVGFKKNQDRKYILEFRDELKFMYAEYLRDPSIGNLIFLQKHIINRLDNVIQMLNSYSN